MSIDWSKTITREAKEAELLQTALANWKVNRQKAVDSIKVTVAGMVFDGDELAQSRMARVVAAADSLEQTTPWTLADNTVATVTVAQLKLALLLAGQAQTTLWNLDRPI